MRVPFLLLFPFVLFSKNLVSQEQQYLWPTSASPYLSSTFGETRSAHFHAGIDIKTWGREGYRVFATKDGIIDRIAITSQGYGRVIYLKHKDGTSSVYAHLQRFRDDLQDYVDSIRYEQLTFEVDLDLESQNIQVTQGEVIGYTGSTGIGPPHLHFEIRNQNNEPINPLLTNLSIPDTIPPRISAIKIVPLSSHSTIEGKPYPKIYSSNSEGTITVNGKGPLGISVSVSDGANEVTNRYAIYELGLMSSSDTLFYQKLTYFSFDETETMFLDRIPERGTSRRSYQVLYKQDGPSIPFNLILDPHSIITPSDSLQSYTVFATDFFGNKSEVNIEFGLYNNTPRSIASNQPNNWYWTENWISGTKNGTLDLNGSFGVNWDSSMSQRILSNNESSLFFQRLNPNEHTQFRIPNQTLKARFKPNTFFDTLSVAISLDNTVSPHSFTIYPEHQIPRKDIEIQFYLGKNFQLEQHYQLYKKDTNDGDLTHMKSSVIGRTLHAWIDELGSFVVLPDTSSPLVETPQLIKKEYGKWVVEAFVYDSLSGINFQNSSITVNGIQGITEYDFEDDKLIYIVPDFTPKQENSILIEVEDKAGNRTIKSYQM